MDRVCHINGQTVWIDLVVGVCGGVKRLSGKEGKWMEPMLKRTTTGVRDWEHGDSLVNSVYRVVC